MTTRKKVLAFAVACAAALCAAAVDVKIDFGKTVGPMKPVHAAVSLESVASKIATNS